jgi:uncharacterized protein (TIGR02246 family)
MHIKSSFLLLAATTALFFQACDKKLDSLHSPQTPTEEGVTKNTHDYARAFNVHDFEKLASLWTEDALYVNLSTGETVEGSRNIANYFKTQFENKKAKIIAVSLSSVSSSGNNTATARGLLETTFEDKEQLKETFLAEYAKTDDIWAIKNLSVNAINTPPSHFENLKDLNWLIGNWVDEDEMFDVTYNTEWDKNKNFITQHFVSSVLGEEELTGTQIIGWNPTTKKIQAWTFDSDGGFGESTWTKEKGRWVVSLHFTLPQGGTATATHIYTPIGQDSYSFASENREIDGNLLPNIGPFKIVRK